MDSEFLEVPVHLKGYVIGTGGRTINEIRQNSGARVYSLNKEEGGFTITGDEEQRTCAKRLIIEKVEKIKKKIQEQSLAGERVEIPARYKGIVIGKEGSNLRRISNQTGAKVIRKSDREVYIVSGTEEQRQKAKVHIKITIAGARLRGLENEFKNSYCYIDSSYLPADCNLKLEKLAHGVHTDDTLLSESRTYYRLTPVQDHEPQDGCSPNDDPAYLSQLRADTLDALYMVKKEIESKEYLTAEMWCHFGTGMIRGANREEANDGQWSIDEVTEKLRPSDGDNWKVVFKEVVNLEERIFEENVCDKTPEEYVDYAARHDLTFLTPSGHQIRFKVWVTKRNVGKRLEDIPLPLSDVKNILEEIHFKDEAMRSRCRGWLVLPSRSYLQADILFPGCEFDCRLTLRGQSDSGLHTDYVPNDEETQALSKFLSELSLTDVDENEISLSSANLPEEFHLVYNRCCKRTQYEISPGFTIILSKERSWRSDAITEETRESKDFFLHCREWDELLNRKEWIPEKIIEKLPDFFRFVKKVQSLVLARTVPPEILARGIAAVKAYNKALSDGTTLVKRVPLMLIGQDRAGKTSLKKSLKGICFDPQEDSTVGIEVGPSHFKVSTETWKTGVTANQYDDTETAISFDYQTARRIACSLKEKRESIELESGNWEGADTLNSEDFKDVEDSRPVEPLQDSEDKTPRLSSSSIGSHEPQVSSVQEVPNKEKVNVPYPDVPDEVAAVTETLLQGDLEDSEEEIYSTVWDFAGQSVYYTTHPLFLTKRAIYCLVYDLSMNPDDEAKPLVKQGLYEENQESFHLKTNFDYLDFWMTSVSSFGDSPVAAPTSDVLPEKLPPVFLVCTHADKPYGRGNPRNLACKIFGRLKKKPYGGHLSDVFFVDNTSLSVKNSDCQEVMRLREEVLSLARELPYINEAVPIKWLQFEKALQAVKENLTEEKCISLESANDIALNVCNIIDHNEFETLMNYLHDLRSIIHFDDNVHLSKVVILDPQWLIDVFKKVITVRPYDPKEKKFLELWSKLESEGILDEQLLAHVWDPLFKDKETSDSLIGIMERFSLLCPWFSNASNNKEYLVPSMLMSHPPQEVHDLIESAEIPSLFVKFSNGHVPAGFFPRLVAQFLQWGKDGFWAQEKPQLFHDFVRFYTSGGVYSVILVCHSSSVEVVIQGGNSNTEDDLYPKPSTFAELQPDGYEVVFTRQVCRKLSLLMECMRNEFPWLKNMKYEMCVICPVCSRGKVVALCQTHRAKKCNEEQCLHFWRVSQLCSDTENISCTRSAVARSTKVQVMQFSPWFPSSIQQPLLAISECDEDPFTSDEANKERALAVRSNVFDHLTSKVYDAKQIVHRLQETLEWNQASLEQPNHEAKKWIRSLTREARRSERLDVVEYLREITPAGTTGPLLPETLDVRAVLFTQARQLTVSLTVAADDKWKLVAEKLGLNQDEIRFLDQRHKNPVEALLIFITNQRSMNVGELYNILCECGIPVIADKL